GLLVAGGALVLLEAVVVAIEASGHRGVHVAGHPIARHARVAAHALPADLVALEMRGVREHDVGALLAAAPHRGHHLRGAIAMTALAELHGGRSLGEIAAHAVVAAGAGGTRWLPRATAALLGEVGAVRKARRQELLTADEG